MKSWTDKYIGIPFKEGGRDFSGCDCGGLVLLALKKEMGIIATDFVEYENVDFKTMNGLKKLGAGLREAIKNEWVEVETSEQPKPFDLLLFNIGKAVCHVGLFVSKNTFLHIDNSLKFSCLESMNSAAWVKNLFGICRHLEMS